MGSEIISGWWLKAISKLWVDHSYLNFFSWSFLSIKSNTPNSQLVKKWVDQPTIPSIGENKRRPQGLFWRMLMNSSTSGGFSQLTKTGMAVGFRQRRWCIKDNVSNISVHPHIKSPRIGSERNTWSTLLIIKVPSGVLGHVKFWVLSQTMKAHPSSPWREPSLRRGARRKRRQDYGSSASVTTRITPFEMWCGHHWPVWEVVCSSLFYLIFCSSTTGHKCPRI